MISVNMKQPINGLLKSTDIANCRTRPFNRWAYFTTLKNLSRHYDTWVKHLKKSDAIDSYSR